MYLKGQKVANKEYDGKMSWESSLAQFNIMAKMDEWAVHKKAWLLAPSLTRTVVNVPSNPHAVAKRQNFAFLVAAFNTRFGMAHTT